MDLIRTQDFSQYVFYFNAPPDRSLSFCSQTGTNCGHYKLLYDCKGDIWFVMPTGRVIEISSQAVGKPFPRYPPIQEFNNEFIIHVLNN